MISQTKPSADDLSNMTAVNAGQIWPLIEDGCLTDWTVSMLPRGPNKEVRFTFESFRFQDSKDGEPVSIFTTFDKIIASEIIRSFFDEVCQIDDVCQFTPLI